jgi:hypothetical protein
MVLARLDTWHRVMDSTCLRTLILTLISTYSTRVYILHLGLWFIRSRSRISELRTAVGLPWWLRELLYVQIFVVTLQ